MTQAEDKKTVLKADDPFQFACHHDLPCFTQCCRDVNIYLTPYDVLRLRKALGLGSTEFLQRHTRHFLAKITHIPVVQLAMDEQTLRCHFVGDAGCTVYDHRPWACRMFPLDLADRDDEYSLLAGKERCFGLREGARWTVAQWLETQEVEPYVVMERAFQALMPPNFQPGQPLEPGLGKLLFLAYDLDRFAAMVDDPKWTRLYQIDPERLQRAREDDEEMLRLAFHYIRSQMAELLEVL
ncbi:hypothetical protein SAMN02746041_02042 [Desulfacinum hydrothermale DSM 13146]|uniref:Uncharacterized protein n=1 Tax=Desulfacinum hydrothermale DSM 13146 TaxID=1121390 RepID=A0A1W1XKQ2_9BACT|nr:YkgJ family cysteine cluster protein [Desulfacinum hydrothermale]SMC24560.1 hypothetical protein SAMN02746041_02042 [Desulfacinum hydrothermale DSM 13146]